MVFPKKFFFNGFLQIYLGMLFLAENFHNFLFFMQYQFLMMILDPPHGRVLCTVLVTIPWAGPPSLIEFHLIDKKSLCTKR